MAQNYINSGERFEVTAPSAGITSGQAVLIGAILGVALTSATVGEKAVVAVTGVYEIPKAAGSVSQGAALYWDAGNSRLTTTAEGNTLAGYAYEASSASTIYCKLVG